MDFEWPVGALRPPPLLDRSVPQVYCTCSLRARARNDPFPREALLFYEGVKEARALPSPQPDAGRVSKRPYLRYTKPSEHLSDRLSSRKREDSQSCVVGHFVNLSPGLRVDAKRTSVGAPRLGSRLVLSHPGKSRFSVAQHSVLPAV